MHKTRNRILTLAIIATLIAVSLSFNIKQLFEVKYYQKLVSSTQVTNEVNPATLATTQSTPIATISVTESTHVNNTELQCLAESIYFESSSQSLVGKYAVGFVVLNRVANPNYPKTVCGVVNQKIGNTCMFSWTCDDHKKIANQVAWKQSQQIALKLLSRKRKDLIDFTDGATHFHAASIDPKWKLKRITKIDDHLFYK